jgi:hypothetical protein
VLQFVAAHDAALHRAVLSCHVLKPACRNVLQRVAPRRSGCTVQFLGSYNKLYHVEPSPRITGGALNPMLDVTVLATSSVQHAAASNVQRASWPSSRCGVRRTAYDILCGSSHTSFLDLFFVPVPSFEPVKVLIIRTG